MSDGLVLADAIYAAGQALHHDACTNDAHDGCDVGDWDREAEIAIRAGMPSVEHQLRVLIAREIESQQEDPTATAAITGGHASAASEGATVTDRLDEIEARAEAATPGPWEADGAEVSQHWSRPKPWATVASSEVVCMAYCYGGIGRGIERETDAEFIAAARTDVPQLVAEVRRLLAENDRLREDARAFAAALDFGDGITEPAAGLADLLEPVQQAFFEANEHQECPAICEPCGEPLARATCDKCHGSGCLPNAELAHLECDECGGVGKLHPGCVEKSYDDLVAEVQRLQAIADALRVETGASDE